MNEGGVMVLWLATPLHCIGGSFSVEASMGNNDHPREVTRLFIYSYFTFKIIVEVWGNLS